MQIQRVFLLLLSLATFAGAQEMHHHGVPEKLGSVHFPISCAPRLQDQFDRAVALLHSFAYSAAQMEFRSILKADPQCAMAHWGIAMTYFHQLWEPPIAPGRVASGRNEIQQARRIGTSSARERRFIEALNLVYEGAPAVPYSERVANYERAMKNIAINGRGDLETQVFYALALLASTSPGDKSHVKQKQAAELLEPLFRMAPQHPGIPHYLIHAYDNAELAPKGIVAARAYAQIAPSAPHALHMPSHIFTRLGLWEDSIKANLASREAAHRQGDVAEELHAMDYLVYACLQVSRDQEALRTIQELKTMPGLDIGDFKVAYAATAMPIRYAVERRRWAEAAMMEPPSGAPPHVVAIAVWARGLGLARTGHIAEARKETDKLREIEAKLGASGNNYWATQTRILEREIMAWSAQMEARPTEAVSLMRQAADEEDSTEKLPVTPGPIIPAREQLGDLLLQQAQPNLALKEFKLALASTPGRLGALQGLADAERQSAPSQK
jgi:tetratricopeptide (TPR) repeat protein